MIAFTHKFPTPNLSKANIQDGLEAAKKHIDTFEPSAVSIEDDRVILMDNFYRLRRKHSPLQLFSKGSVQLDVSAKMVVVRLEYLYLLLSFATYPILFFIFLETGDSPLILIALPVGAIITTTIMYYRIRKFARNIHSQITEALEDPFKT
jgi:hypothetical protein